MGTVYEALDARLGRRVALKVLSPEPQEQAQGGQAVRHRGAGGRPPRRTRTWSASSTSTWKARSRTWPWNSSRAKPWPTPSHAGRWPSTHLADIMLAVCAGVHAAHGKGIVHRDLKPSNIFLCPDWQGRETRARARFRHLEGGWRFRQRPDRDRRHRGHVPVPFARAGRRRPPRERGQRPVFAGRGHVRVRDWANAAARACPSTSCSATSPTAATSPPGSCARISPAALEAVIERAMSVRPKDRFPSVHELGQAPCSRLPPPRSSAASTTTTVRTPT